MLFGATSAKAGNVTVEQAKSVAAHFMGSRMGIDKLTPDQLTLVYQIDNPDLNIPAAYFFNLESCGWVVIAGTTVIDPIVAYNDEGSLVVDQLPANMLYWMEGYAGMISDIQKADAENNYSDHVMWTALSSSNVKGTRGDQVILMNERWDQGDERNPTYNLYCPKVGNRWSMVGCVATALAQICHYYKYPVRPTGFHRYWWEGDGNSTLLALNYDTMYFDYTLMPNRVTSTSQPAKIREVAKLSYALGVAVNMSYHPDGSGAHSDDIPDAMESFFKYQHSNLISRSNTYNFVERIRGAVEERHPVYMSATSTTGSGADAAGHAFIVAGYETGDAAGSEYNYYYFNWGWDGAGNGFYNLGENDMPIAQQYGGYNFIRNQRAIVNLLPPADTLGICSVDPTVLGHAYPNPAAFSVKVPYSTQTAADLMVYSIDGKMVESVRVQPGDGEVVVRVDALPKGVYIYRLNSQSGKFVVQ